MKPPIAAKIPKHLTIHGDTRIDNYYWLNERDNPKVIEYLTAENDYTKEIMKDDQDRLYDEIIGRITQTDMSVPFCLNHYYYYTRYEEGKEYPVYCRKKESLDADEEIMLDINKMAEGYPYYAIGAIHVSPDNKMLAYGVDTVSRRLYTIHFKNLETEEILPESIPETVGSAHWANDNKTLFITKKHQQTLRPYQILRYKLGENKAPEVIYEEKDETFICYASKSRSREYITIQSNATVSDEYRILSADDPDGEFQIVQERERDLEYNIEHYKDRLFIRTNLNAQNFRLMEATLSGMKKEDWKEVIPHRSEVLLESFTIFNDFMVLNERIKGNTKLRVIHMDTKEEHSIKFKEDVYTASISINPELDSHLFRFEYTSLTTPRSIYDYNMMSREMLLLKREEVVGGHDPDQYQSERLYATAEDGKEVPVSIVYKKGTPLDGSAPLLLHGYGSYGLTFSPSFNSALLSLLDRGFIYAIAHVRGGQMLGRGWYDDGKLLNKKNTFTDFIDCATHLVKNGYTSTDKLMAMGQSAGGLLMGSIANMRPDLFKGIISTVPFVDLITTMLDESIPLTTGEYDEWGNPNSREDYDYMLSYSPYDNVAEQNYPNMLVTTGLHDSQVQYWEPAKWVAKLRDMKTDDNLLLLHTNMDAGHSGSSGRFRLYEEIAMGCAFMLKLTGINI